MNRFFCSLLPALYLMLGIVTTLHAEERVRVCCDRSLYAAGETIWMRGWITDVDGAAATSKFMYVELLRDGAGSVEMRIKLKERGGMFLGQMELPEDLESGWYTLRAYTLAQKDWPAEALFHTRVLIRGTGAISGLYAAPPAQADNDERVQAKIVFDTDGHLSVSLIDTDGSPVAGNFALSVVPGRYADFDYQQEQAIPPVPSASFVEGPREYAQELAFRIKSVRRRLPEQYSVAIMSQDIGYYVSTDIDSDNSISGKEGQLFRIPDLDFPEGTLFSVNVNGSPYIYPESESEVFADPFDYGPTYPIHEELRDTALIRARLEGTVSPRSADDTITTSHITAERKPSFYRPERIIGPYSTVFEWRQVQLREQLSPYDDRDLMMHITSFYPGFIISYDPENFQCNMYTTRGGSVSPSGYSSFHPVDLYIDGIKQEDWSEARTLSVRDVQNLYVLRGTEAALYRASAVVLLELRHFDYKELNAVQRTEHQVTIGLLPLGWQKPKTFDPSPVAGLKRQGTLYWNPCIRTDAQGHADIALPELLEGCYFRLVGQTLDGRWFSTQINAPFPAK
jgi:hypothetical protein